MPSNMKLEDDRAIRSWIVGVWRRETGHAPCRGGNLFSNCQPTRWPDAALPCEA